MFLTQDFFSHYSSVDKLLLMINIMITEFFLQEDYTVPIYEYQCRQCGKIYEVFQSTTDEPLKKCKDCLGEVTKLISNCSFQLKGTGWYVTDYARSDSGKTGSTVNKESTPEPNKASESTASANTEKAPSKTND